jgi:hypothetical protein
MAGADIAEPFRAGRGALTAESAKTFRTGALGALRGPGEAYIDCAIPVDERGRSGEGEMAWSEIGEKAPRPA